MKTQIVTSPVQRYLSSGDLSRGVPSDELLSGIMSCGSVEAYYNFQIQQDKEKIRQMRANAARSGIQVLGPFPDNAHEVIESAVTEIGRKPLTLTQELLNEGLTTPLPNWWAIPSLRRARTGQAGRAHRSMVPDSRGERFVLTRDGVSWPMYCTWANFSFDIRELAIGQRMGTPLDVSHSEWATYMGLEAVEDQIINGLTDEQGNTLTIDGMTAPGILSSTNTWTYAAWTGLTGNQILQEVQSAITDLRLTHPNMPLTLFIPTNYSDVVGGDYNYTAGDSKSVKQRLEQLGPYGGRTLKVVLADTLPDSRVVLMAMDKRAVDLVVGQQFVPLSWKDGLGFNTFWVVLGMMVFRMFADKNGVYPVVIGNV